MKLFRLFRKSLSAMIFVIVLCGWAISASIWAMSLTAQLAAAGVAQAAAVTKAVAREKAKGRLKRVVIAVPVLGSVAAMGFEAYEYSEWQEENPEGDIGDYGCEVSRVSAEVVDEVLSELPEVARPSPGFILNRLPDCADTPGDALDRPET